MPWRDFFYFSTGERRALIILLSLIAIAAIILIVNNGSPEERAEEAARQETESPPAPSQSAKAIDTPYVAEAPPKKTAAAPKKTKKSETVKERVDRMTSVGRPSYARIEKFKAGTVVELNAADTTTLKKVPGIGSAFASRIVKYRNLLGGYYSVSQLSEVYGMDEERYSSLAPWFRADPSLVRKLDVNQLPQDSLRRHPYIDYKQARAICRLRRKGKLSGWENLQLLEEFTDADKDRLSPYLSFE